MRSVGELTPVRSPPVSRPSMSVDFTVGELPVVVPNDEPLREQLKKEAERLRATDIEVVEELQHKALAAMCRLAN